MFSKMFDGYCWQISKPSADMWKLIAAHLRNTLFCKNQLNFILMFSAYTPRLNIQMHHKRWLCRYSGYSFTGKFLKELYVIVILSFSFWNSEPQNSLKLFFLYQFQLLIKQILGERLPWRCSQWKATKIIKIQ